MALQRSDEGVDDAVFFGPDPNHLLGLTHLSSSKGPGGLAMSVGHSNYLTANTTSQRNLAAIVAGRPDLAVYGTQDEEGFGDHVREHPSWFAPWNA